jgi:hypothetical protein
MKYKLKYLQNIIQMNKDYGNLWAALATVIVCDELIPETI